MLKANSQPYRYFMYGQKTHQQKHEPAEINI